MAETFFKTLREKAFLPIKSAPLTIAQA